MAILQLPVKPDLPSYSFFVILDGATYKMDFDWSERTQIFTFTFSDVDENPILSGRQLVPDTDLLLGVAPSLKPPGLLMLFDTETSGSPPVLGQLGTVYELVYYEAETLATL